MERRITTITVDKGSWNKFKVLTAFDGSSASGVLRKFIKSYVRGRIEQDGKVKVTVRLA